jgi:BlaI family penicillinase repressor
VSDPRSLPGGKLEYAVLLAVWKRGEATTRDIHDDVGVPLDLVYTTTSRVLDRLHAKGLISREKQGKNFLYRAAVARSEVDRAHIARTLVGFFRDEPRPALAHLVEAIESIDPELLDVLALAVDARRRSRHEP